MPESRGCFPISDLVALSPGRDSASWWRNMAGQTAHLMAERERVNEEKAGAPTTTFKDSL